MSLAVRRAIYGKLAGDTTLTNLLGSPSPRYTKAIYYQLAPDDAPASDSGFPYIIFNEQSGTPSYGMASTTVMDNEIWLIKAVGRGDDADPADNVADRLNVLVTDGTLSIAGKTQLYLRRESDLPSYSETVDGQRYIHAGALFRLTYV